MSGFASSGPCNAIYSWFIQSSVSVPLKKTEKLIQQVTLQSSNLQHYMAETHCNFLRVESHSNETPRDSTSSNFVQSRHLASPKTEMSLNCFFDVDLNVQLSTFSSSWRNSERKNLNNPKINALVWFPLRGRFVFPAQNSIQLKKLQFSWLSVIEMFLFRTLFFRSSCHLQTVLLKHCCFRSTAKLCANPILMKHCCYPHRSTAELFSIPISWISDIVSIARRTHCSTLNCVIHLNFFVT